MPHKMELPTVGTTVAGEVLWHIEHNRHMKIKLDEWNMPKMRRVAEPILRLGGGRSWLGEGS
ncbi:hypothetical protein [Streptomyces sp. NPDC002845]